MSEVDGESEVAMAQPRGRVRAMGGMGKGRRHYPMKLLPRVQQQKDKKNSVSGATAERRPLSRCSSPRGVRSETSPGPQPTAPAPSPCVSPMNPIPPYRAQGVSPFLRKMSPAMLGCEHGIPQVSKEASLHCRYHISQWHEAPIAEPQAPRATQALWSPGLKRWGEHHMASYEADRSPGVLSSSRHTQPCYGL